MIPPIQCKKPTVKWALLFLALLAPCLLVLSGCSASAAEPKAPALSMHEIQKAVAGAWLCPGMTAIWLNEQTVQCLRDHQ